MGIFSKPEIIIFKESNSAEEHLAKLEELLPRATGKVKENIQKEMILTKRRYLQQQGRLYVRYVVESLCFERHAAERMQENNFMAVPVFQSADTY